MVYASRDAKFCVSTLYAAHFLYCVFWSLLCLPRFLYMHPLRLRSMKNRMTRRLPDITVWNIPSCAFRINACDKINNVNLTILLC